MVLHEVQPHTYPSDAADSNLCLNGVENGNRTIFGGDTHAVVALSMFNCTGPPTFWGLIDNNSGSVFRPEKSTARFSTIRE